MSTEFPKIITITGLSQVGKTTVIQQLAKWNPDLIVEPKSYTTRKPRSGDTNYVYVGGKEFSDLIKAGKLAEWVCYGAEGHYYGVDRINLEAILESGRIPTIPIVASGIFQLRSLYPHIRIVSILLLPETITECIHRMAQRGISRNHQHYRMREFQKDLQEIDLFDQIVVNRTDKIFETARLIIKNLDV